SLFHSITDSNTQCLQMVHFHHYHWQQTLSQHPNNGRLLVNDVVRTFRVKANHLRPPVKFNFRLLHEISIQSFPEIEDKDFLLNFTAIFGNQYFSKNDVKVKRENIEGMEVIRCLFETDIEMREEEIDSRITYKVADIKEENTLAAIVLYPTLGFHFSLNYS